MAAMALPQEGIVCGEEICCQLVDGTVDRRRPFYDGETEGAARGNLIKHWKVVCKGSRVGARDLQLNGPQLVHGRE